jgi:hypothetical protein
VRWRAFVQFQVDHLVGLMGGGKFHLELTPSQRMALLDVFVEYMRHPDFTEVIADCSTPDNKETTVGDFIAHGQ